MPATTGNLRAVCVAVMGSAALHICGVILFLGIDSKVPGPTSESQVIAPPIEVLLLQAPVVALEMPILKTTALMHKTSHPNERKSQLQTTLALQETGERMPDLGIRFEPKDLVSKDLINVAAKVERAEPITAEVAASVPKVGGSVGGARPDYAYNPQPDYPLLLREQGVGGVVWLRVWVGSDGHPGEIKLAKGSGYRLLDDAALLAVRHWRFIPAQNGELRLASWVEFPVRFTLNG